MASRPTAEGQIDTVLSLIPDLTRAARFRQRSARRPTWPVTAGINPALSPPVFWARDETRTHQKTDKGDLR